MAYFPTVVHWLERWFSPQLIYIVFLLIAIIVIVLCVSLCVAYLTYLERKVIGYIQLRIGPNRVGIYGLLQPIADAVKLIAKEVIVPTKSSPFLFFVAPILALAPALMAWAVIPFAWHVVIADVNAGLVYVLAVASLGVYSMIIAGWASNSRYALLGAIRSGAQMVSYEVSMGFAVLCVLLVSGQANLSHIVLHQTTGFFHQHGLNILSWNWIPLFPVFLVYFISGLAETNRHPFDVVEGESEIVAGFHVEYSGMAFALFFLAEYANMMLISAMTVVMFLGGWDAPLGFLSFIPGLIWFVIKVALLLFVFLWVRATFPRYRYDQIMRLGWRVFLPVTVIWLIVVSFFLLTPLHPWL